MTLDSLALRTAQTFVNSYAHEDDVVQQHSEAMDCRDCEAFLQLGIDAFNWVIRADQVTRQVMFSGDSDFVPDDVEAAIRALCKLWLKPCDRANQWVAVQHSRGFKVDNLDAFRNCCVEMRAIVKAQETEGNEDLPAKMAILRDQAIEEHRNGQTAEFI